MSRRKTTPWVTSHEVTLCVHMTTHKPESWHKTWKSLCVRLWESWVNVLSTCILQHYLYQFKAVLVSRYQQVCPLRAGDTCWNIVYNGKNTGNHIYTMKKDCLFGFFYCTHQHHKLSHGFNAYPKSLYQTNKTNVRIHT